MVRFLSRWAAFSTTPNPLAGEPPTFLCPQLLVQHIRSYPPHLEDSPPSATWGWFLWLWKKSLITVIWAHWSLWQGPIYHCQRNSPITVTGTHLSLSQKPTNHYDMYALSLWQEPPYHWYGPTYHCDRHPLITVIWTQLSLTNPLVTAMLTHLSLIRTHLSLWRGPTYHLQERIYDSTGTHLSLWYGHTSLWQGPTYHCYKTIYHCYMNLPITATGTQLSLWHKPTYHCHMDPLITVKGTSSS